MSSVTWAQPYGEKDTHIRICKRYLALTVGAVDAIKLSYVNVGITPEGVIVIAPGDHYVVSLSKTQLGYRARVGGSGLVRQLLDQGAILGNYKLVSKGKHWEAYPVAVEPPQAPSACKCRTSSLYLLTFHIADYPR